MNKLQKHYAACAAIGCIVCRREGAGYVPASVHHPWGRTNGNEFRVIGLCFSHHQSGVKTDLYVSRHPYRRAFLDKYGSEESMLAEVDVLIEREKRGIAA